MYHSLLTNRYLTSRVIPLIAVAAVALCVALVIIVVSIMSGFLDMVKSSGRTLIGDVVVGYPVAGIPYYEKLIEHIEKLPEAAAATPVVDSWGLLRMPYPEGDNKQIETVQIWGIAPTFAEVTGYRDTIYWGGKRELSPNQRRWLFRDLIDRHWQATLESLSIEQRAAILREVHALRNPDISSAPGDAAFRDIAAGMQQPEWERYFYVLADEPELLEKILTPQQWQALLSNDPRLENSNQLIEHALTLQRDGEQGIALGILVSQGNRRQPDGTYEPMETGYWWMPRFEVMLQTIPVSGGLSGADRAQSRIFPVLNEYESGVYIIDDKRVMIPLQAAQEMMNLNQAERVDDEGNVIGVDPAKATMVLVRAATGITPKTLQEAVRRAYDDFARDVSDDEGVVVFPPPRGDQHIGGATILTWEQQQAQFIGPVEKERQLMRILFSIVYVVCAGLVLAIFWAIVHEKTRDIGILRSIGASRLGVSWVFLRYGLVVGVLGAMAGLGLGALIVRNINEIQGTLENPPPQLHFVILGLAGIALVVTIIRSLSGDLLPLVLGALITIALLALGVGALLLYQMGGFTMWNPEVYLFTKIPNKLDVTNAVITMVGAVIFSLIGAFIPAAKAADTDPVNALRYE